MAGSLQRTTPGACRKPAQHATPHPVSWPPQEAELFDASAQHAYESFRNKAASSRDMDVEDMQAVAQGRVWSGNAAIKVRSAAWPPRAGAPAAKLLCSCV